MSNVYEKVKYILNNNNQKKNYRILVLSDGQIGDQDRTVTEAENIKLFINNSNYSISVGSIRYNSGFWIWTTRYKSNIVSIKTKYRQ